MLPARRRVALEMNVLRPEFFLHFGVMKSFLLIVIVFYSISEIIPGLFQIINQPGYDGRSWSGSAFRSLKHSPGQLGSLDRPLLDTGLVSV